MTTTVQISLHPTKWQSQFLSASRVSQCFLLRKAVYSYCQDTSLNTTYQPKPTPQIQATSKQELNAVAHDWGMSLPSWNAAQLETCSWKQSLEQRASQNAGSALLCKLQGKLQQSCQKHCKCYTRKKRGIPGHKGHLKLQTVRTQKAHGFCVHWVTQENKAKTRGWL